MTKTSCLLKWQASPLLLDREPRGVGAAMERGRQASWLPKLPANSDGGGVSPGKALNAGLREGLRSMPASTPHVGLFQGFELQQQDQISAAVCFCK